MLWHQHVLVFNPNLGELGRIAVSRLLLLHIAEAPFLLLYPAAAHGQTLEGSEGFCVSTKGLRSSMWFP